VAVRLILRPRAILPPRLTLGFVWKCKVVSPEFRIAMLVLGVLLLLVAAFGGLLFGRAAPAAGRLVRVLAGIGGAAVLGWILVPQLTAPAPTVSPAVTNPEPAPAEPAPVDVMRIATLALEDCPLPTAPSLPEGATATKKQIAAAREAFQAYDAATNTYLKCVDAAMESARKSAGSASEADLETLKTFGTSAHNTAIDQEQAVADQLNTLVRAYNAKHPPG
jgi:hypothetical protein